MNHACIRYNLGISEHKKTVRKFLKRASLYSLVKLYRHGSRGVSMHGGWL